MSPLVTVLGFLIAGYLGLLTVVVCYLGFANLGADAREADLVPESRGVGARTEGRPA